MTKNVKDSNEVLLSIIQKELQENAEDLDLNNIDPQKFLAMINANKIQLFNDVDYDDESIIDYYIKNISNSKSFLINDHCALLKRYKLWKKNLPNIEIFYAVKCNPNKLLLETLAYLDVGFDVASKGEIILIKDFNVPRDKIIFANPVKEDLDLQYAESQNIFLMTFDTVDELKKISCKHPKALLVLRIMVDDSKSIHRFNTKFGAPPHNISELLDTANNLNLNIIGVSFHVGSGCQDPVSYKDAIILAREVFDLAKEFGYNMNFLDIGGGFPGHDTKESNQIFINFAKAINEQLEISFSDIEDLRIIAEPGRFFATSTGLLATNIIGKKILYEDQEKIIHYYVNSNTYGIFNNIIFDKADIKFFLPKKPECNFKFSKINNFKKNKKKFENEKFSKFYVSNQEDINICEDIYHGQIREYKSVIFGQTCDSLDVICKDTKLPELNIGNWLYVKNHGAYTSAAGSKFNGFDLVDSYDIFWY